MIRAQAERAKRLIAFTWVHPRLALFGDAGRWTEEERLASLSRSQSTALCMPSALRDRLLIDSRNSCITVASR